MAELPDTSFNPQVIEEFRANGGKVGGPWREATLLLLHTTGAKSGQPRVTPVGCFDVDGRQLIVGSYAGADVNPAWVHNLRAHPRTRIEIGTDTVEVYARELDEQERDAAWSRIAEIAAPFAEYRGQTRRVIPIFALERSPA